LAEERNGRSSDLRLEGFGETRRLDYEYDTNSKTAKEITEVDVTPIPSERAFRAKRPRLHLNAIEN
jgi:hypothetical protein